MIYKKELIETFTFESSTIEHIHIFKNGKIDCSIVKFVPQNVSTTFHVPEYEHLHKMLKQNIDVKIDTE